MKSIINIFIIFISFVLCFSARASADSPSFYIKPTVGVSSFSKIIEEDDFFDIKQKSNYSPNFSMSIGSYINNNLRTELTIGYDVVNFEEIAVQTAPPIGDLPEIQEVLNESGWGYIDAREVKLSVDYFKRKATLPHTLVSMFFDLPINKTFDLFIGGGVGCVNLSEIVSAKASVQLNGITLEQKPQKIKTNTYNLMYHVGLGTSIKINNDCRIELGYMYKDFGSANLTRKWEDGDKLSKAHYKSHNLNLGIRYNL